MTWTQATFVVDAKQVEPLSTLLETFMAAAVTTENAGEDEFFEVAFPGTPDWEKVQVTGLFDENIDLEPIINFVQNHFASELSTEIPVSVNKLVDQDWERVWLMPAILFLTQVWHLVRAHTPLRTCVYSGYQTNHSTRKTYWTTAVVPVF